MGRLRGVIQKEWFVAILLILLAVETAILVVITVEWSLANQNFPPVAIISPLQPQCSTLTPHPSLQNSENRSVIFDCSGSGNGPALKVYFPPFTGPASFPPHWSVAPTFNLPDGYLQLSLQPMDRSTCPYPNQPALKSGHTIIVGFEGFSLNYCAVISNSTGKVRGFNISWHPASCSPSPPSHPLGSC